MIRSMPWQVGARELLARPVARGRGQGLSRLTAAGHGPWVWVALWVAAAAAAVGALIPAFSGDGPSLPAHEVIHLLSGFSFARAITACTVGKPRSLRPTRISGLVLSRLTGTRSFSGS